MREFFRKNKRLSTILLAVFFILPLSAMDWPLEERDLHYNFGWNDNGRSVLGNIFVSEEEIYATDDGEVIFSQNGYNSASRLPAPLGNWLALDHGEGLISVYSRFSSEKVNYPNLVQKATPLARSGRSGWSNINGLVFSIFDRKERRWVNPSMIIPPLPDTRAPVIQSVSLRSASEGIAYELVPNQTRNISQGLYTISVVAYDTLVSPTENPIAPYRIICIVNGSEIGTLNFETYSARDGVLMVHRNGLVPVRQVYEPVPGFEVGESWFTRGQAVLDIIVSDISGNSQTAQFRLTVD